MQYPRLALRDRAGREVEDQRLAPRQRNAGRERVRAEARVGAAEGRDDAARNDVDEMQRDQTARHRPLGPRTDAAQMVRVAEREDAASALACTLDADLHRLAAHHLAEAGLTVEPQQRAGVEHSLQMGVRLQATLEIRLDVARQHADAVRVVPREIGIDEIGADLVDLLRRAAEAGDDEPNRRAQRFDGHDV